MKIKSVIFKSFKIFTIIIVFLILLFDVLILIFSNSGFIFNKTKSMPIGLYKIENKEIEKGDIVTFCLYDDQVKRYPSNGNETCKDHNLPLLKEVVATKGDIVTINDYGIFVNNQYLPNSKPLNNKVKRALLSNYRLKENEIIVKGTHINSWDSRYYGILDKNNILTVLSPFFVINFEY